MIINFPKSIATTKSGIEFLCFIWGMTKKMRDSIITWDLKYTKKLETNLLSFLGLILNRNYNHNNKIRIIIRDSSGKIFEYNDCIIERLFQKYSVLEYNAVQYRYLNLNDANSDDNKSFLNNELMDLNLEYNKEIKVLLSEFIANIDMHTDLKECAIAGYVDIKTMQIKFSICNMGRTIKQNIKEKNKYNFEADVQAIIWALKKTNTTRKKEESGGLGLYLLRKYLNNANGSGQVVSGKGLVKLEQGFYDRDNINNITLGDNQEIVMRSFFPGTIITINFKYIKSKESKEINYLKEFSLI